MRPIFLKRFDLAWQTAVVLNRLGRKIGRTARAYVIAVYEPRTVYALHFPEVEHGEVTAILRLLLSGYSEFEITPIMVAHERAHPCLGARPA